MSTNREMHNKRVERDSNFGWGLIGHGFGLAPHPNRSAGKNGKAKIIQGV